MALIKCVDCSKEISDKAKVCPYCGCPVEFSIGSDEAMSQSDEPETTPTNEITSASTTDIEYANPLTGEGTTQKLEQNKSTVKRNVFIVLCVAASIFLILLGSGAFNSTTNDQHEDKKISNNNEQDIVASSEKNKIEYITDRTTDYDKANNQHRVFFGFTDANKTYIAADSGIVTITINDLTGNKVYSKSINFSQKDFTDWTNNTWDGSRLLACIYISNKDITAGSSEQGTLTISCTTNGLEFDPTTINIYDLPVKEISIKLPTTPCSYNEYDYSKKLKSVISIDEISYTSSGYDYKNTSVTFNLKVHITSRADDSIKSYTNIGYAIKDSGGVIVDSGTFLISPSGVGEIVSSDQQVYNLDRTQAYTLSLANAIE